MPKPGPVALCLFLLPADLDTELSTILGHHVCLYATMLPAVIKINQTSELLSQPRLNAFFYKSFCGHGVSHSNRILTSIDET